MCTQKNIYLLLDLKLLSNSFEMPKTHSEYNRQVKYRTSDKWMLLLENGRRSKAAREEFGVGTIPNVAQFYRGIVYDWFVKNAPELIDLNGEIPEVKDLKKSKAKHSENKKRIDFYFNNRDQL